MTSIKIHVHQYHSDYLSLTVILNYGPSNPARLIQSHVLSLGLMCKSSEFLFTQFFPLVFISDSRATNCAFDFCRLVGRKMWKSFRKVVGKSDKSKSFSATPTVISLIYEMRDPVTLLSYLNELLSFKLCARLSYAGKRISRSEFKSTLSPLISSYNLRQYSRVR